MKKLFFALGLCLVLLFAGCGGQNENTDIPTYTVTFVMRGHICSEQTVQDRHLPKSVLTNVSGLQFVQWCDENGEPVNPYTTFVHKDLRYVAEAYPELTNHVPYLFLDEKGNLRPDAPLTANELSAALDALATEDAKAYFPGMPMGDQAITLQMLVDTLANFFPEETVKAAFDGTKEKMVSRSCFAQGMQRLLGREETETLSMDRSVILANDITRDREDAIVLMEASMLHTPFTSERTWSEVELPVRYESGFVNIDGWLYYVQQNYLFLKNGSVGSFYFGADGCYSSGDEKLDQQVAHILTQLEKANPGANRHTLLRAAFDHCCQYDFHEKTVFDYGHTGWELEEALLMFLDEKGDSYNYAAAFWALARGLGYEAQVVSGTRGMYNIPHGWVIITIDAEEFFFDPAAQRDNPKENLFMFAGNQITAWNYKWEQ